MPQSPPPLWSTKLAVCAGQDKDLYGDISPQRGLFLCPVMTVYGQCDLAQPKRHFSAPGIAAACGPLKMRWPQQGHSVNYSD